MDGRRAREVTLAPETLPRLRRHGSESLPRLWAIVLGGGWPLLLLVTMAIAPEPTDPNAVPSLLDTLAFLAIMVGLAGTIGAAAGRHPKLFTWSAALGGVWVATSITCPVSGHHGTVGWQWYVDLGTSSVLLVASLVGLAANRSRRAPGQLAAGHSG